MNRIVLEISSERGKSFRTVELTKELTELIMDFVNPFFSDSKVSTTMNIRQQFTINKCKKEEEDTSENILKLENDKKDKCKMFGVYELRAIDWAIARLGDLLRPNIETEIPELEALLAVDGPRPHDLSFEKCLQKNLLESMNLMDKYSLHNNKPIHQSIGWSNWMGYIDTKRYNLMEQIQKVNSHDEKDPKNDVYQELVAFEWAWSRNPYRWYLHLKNTMLNNSRSTQRKRSTSLISDSELSAELPFLHQMKDFLIRHENEDNLEDLILDEKAQTTTTTTNNVSSTTIVDKS